MPKTDAQTIAICRQMLFVTAELEVLIKQDAEAPDRGPNHDRHEALLAEYAELAAALTKATAPNTKKGVRLLAELAMTIGTRGCEGNLRPDSFGAWLQLFALSSAAKKPEMIPLPEDLPIYWPERTC